MTSIFVANSFSGEIDYATGLVKPEYRKNLEGIIESLRNVGGFSVFCAIEHEGWAISDQRPSVGIEFDLKRIDESNAFLYLPSANASEGAAFELAYALSNPDRRVMIATPEGKNYLRYALQGVVELGMVEHIVFGSPDDLSQQVSACLDANN